MRLLNRIAFGLALALVAGAAHLSQASEGEKPVERSYTSAPASPRFQTWEQAEQKSAGCISCHESSDQKTMHRNPAVILGCTDCHGGDATVMRPPGTGPAAPGHKDGHGKMGHAAGAEGHDDGHAPRIFEPAYMHAMESAHVLPEYPHTWNYPSSANPKHSYTLLNHEAPEYIRFVNPSDYRIVDAACGACHLQEIQAGKRSLMATGAMLWGGGAYNNGILPFKNYILGEGYMRDGTPASLKSLIPDDASDAFKVKLAKRGVLPQFFPMPAFEVVPPGDIFRIFERGGRNIGNLFPEIGLPDALGQLQRLEEPGRPDFRQSNRGPGTGLRIAVPVLNITKTRLNDPFMWFLGTNDNPGDFRTSGCGGCHVVYANNREEKASGPYARDGHWGESQTVDPTIPHNERGHPLKHEFTRAVPTAQCMNCHMHQPNIFLNSFLGYTMWDYESDAPSMWPKKQRYPTAEEEYKVLIRNPEEAAIRGKWSDTKFMSQVYDMNPTLKNTQFADYHGHGWNFRAIFKKNRKGDLLDADGHIVQPDDPKKWEKAVHMSSIHVDKGMHCIDCHFANDGHGNGYIYGEVANAIEIRCKDCHGTVDSYPTLRTSGPAARPGGFDLSVLRTMDGRLRFEWRGDDCEKPLDQRVDCRLYQRPSLWGTDMPDPTEPSIKKALGPNREWEVSLVRDSVNPKSPRYNPKAARAKLMSRDKSMKWGWGVAAKEADRAHRDDDMMCFTCHLSWTTSCAGCHLPIQANRKMPRIHYEGGVTRNFATYNPQVVRDQMFQLGKHMTTKGATIAPVRSSSALVLSSRNINRERIYTQQPPIAASGYSSQAFAPHFPHTVRRTETKTCTDCHLSEANDNNAIMAQLLLQGTNFVNFIGFNAWVGGNGGLEAVTVTEWDEPQAVIGSYLQKYAYPDWYAEHQKRGRELPDYYTQPGGHVGCLQLRGEYLYAAEGPDGFQAYDVASIGNKGISDRIITAPFGPLGHDTHIDTTDATCVVLPTDQPIHPARQTHDLTGQRSDEEQAKLMFETNQEQPFHPIYKYAFITDSVEGLILVDVDTLADGEPRNNFLKRALTWNAGGILDGARHLTIAGNYFYIAADKGIVVLNMDDPLKPRVVTVIDLPDVRASALQFRYLFVTDRDGLQIVDVTNPEAPEVLPGAVVPLTDAHRVYVARTYAYVAAGSQGLAIIDVERPDRPKVYQMFAADGRLNDAHDVVVGSTNASLFAYVADGANGLKVIQLTSPESQPRFYGYSPEPKPELIAWRKTDWPALSLSKGLDRDRAVDETGGQIAVLGRLGSRPFNLKEQRSFYLNADMSPWTVTDRVEKDKYVPGPPSMGETAERRHQDDHAEVPTNKVVE